jgi:hypothetical protein
MIDGADGRGYLEAFDDDAGGRLFGSNPRIVVTAGEAGTFFVIVGDDNAGGPGAYRLSVDRREIPPLSSAAPEITGVLACVGHRRSSQLSEKTRPMQKPSAIAFSFAAAMYAS